MAHRQIPIPPPPLINGTLNSIQDCDGNEYLKTCMALVELCILLVFSNLFHLVLRRFGQPSVISQILAGMTLTHFHIDSMISGGILSMIQMENPDPNHQGNFITSFASIGRIFFMFLVGLETDIYFLMRTTRSAGVIAGGGAASSAAVALLMTPVLFWLQGDHGDFSAATKAMGQQANEHKAGWVPRMVILVLILANTASPVVIRMAAELKLIASEVGRLVVSAALINDMSCLLALALAGTAPSQTDEQKAGTQPNDPTAQEMTTDGVRHGAKALVLGVVAPVAVRLVAKWLNRQGPERRSIGGGGVTVLLILILVTSIYTEVMGYNSMIISFVLGLAVPREGPTSRTLMGLLSYPVYNIVLPVYFATSGMQINIRAIRDLRIAVSVFILVFVGIAGKVAGTVFATNYLKIPFKEGLVLGFLLNVKGHVDLIIVNFAKKSGIIGLRFYTSLMISVLLCTLTAGPVAAYIVRRERRARRSPSTGLQWLSLGRELRLVACVHANRDVPTMLDLVELSSGNNRTPFAGYLMHLVERTAGSTATALYHQLEANHFDQSHGGENARQINDAVDAFARSAHITLRQLGAVSPYPTMHEDVCNAAADVRASLAVLPFHKRQRIDGRMGAPKDDIRELNIKVLRQATCSVGILVDRGMAAPNHSTANSGEVLHHVAALFFGGPDDREAVAYAGRISMNAFVSVTIVRFMPGSRAGGGGEAFKETDMLMSVDNQRMESYADEQFMSDFYSRFIASGMVTYVERLVDNGPETVSALSSMEGMYSLIIVGKGGRQLSPLTTGMTEWEECPELGPIGDLLASSDFTTGSVLVVQQHHLSLIRGGSRDDFTL